MPASYRSTAKYSKQRLLRAPENLSKVGRLAPDGETRKYEPKWGNLPVWLGEITELFLSTQNISAQKSDLPELWLSDAAGYYVGDKN